MKKFLILILSCATLFAAEPLTPAKECSISQQATQITTALSVTESPHSLAIAEGFESWKPETPRTALSYAEHLASLGDNLSKQQAQAIIFYGAGFGGFAKNRKANAQEMGQYFNIINQLKGMIPDEKSLGLSGRDDVTYHQNVMHLLANQEAQQLQEISKIQRYSLRTTDSFRWLGMYAMHCNSVFCDIHNELANFQLLQQKSPCVYNGYFDASPQVHPYGTQDDEQTFAHCTFAKHGAFIVISDPLNSWQNKDILLRPHAYMGYHAKIGAGKSWSQKLEASVTWSDSETKDCSGPVHIHDHVASPAGVMVLDKYENLMAKGPFVTHITSHHPIKTLHILVPNQKQGFSPDQFSTTELVGYLAFVYPNPTYQKFILEQLKAS